jgi:hypothetical protein
MAPNKAVATSLVVRERRGSFTKPKIEEPRGEANRPSAIRRRHFIPPSDQCGIGGPFFSGAAKKRKKSVRTDATASDCRHAASQRRAGEGLA